MQKMQQLELKPFFLAILIIPSLVGATDYFVDSEAGNDAASGTCPEAAWKTLARTARAVRTNVFSQLSVIRQT